MQIKLYTLEQVHTPYSIGYTYYVYNPDGKIIREFIGVKNQQKAVDMVRACNKVQLENYDRSICY